VVGHGDVAFNERRNILGSVPGGKKIGSACTVLTILDRKVGIAYIC